MPQYDEEISPIPFKQPERLVPVQPVANPAPAASKEDKDPVDPKLRKEFDEFAEEMRSTPLASSSSRPSGVRGDDPVDPFPEVDPDADFSVADPMDVAPLDDVAVPEGAASSAPKSKAQADGHPLDDKLLKDLAERELKRAPNAPEHLRSHFPKNPFCKICRIAKDTSMRVSRKPDGRADDMLDPPKEPFEQLASPRMTLSSRKGPNSKAQV